MLPFFGLLGLFAYLFTSIKLRGANRLERVSVREAIEGQQIFNADQVIHILQTFQTDDARLNALRELAKVQNKSQDSADRIYRKIKGAVDIVENQKVQLTQIHRISRGIAPFFLGLAVVSFGYGVVTNPDFTTIASNYFSGDKVQTFSFPDIVGQDGEGNHVSDVSNIQVTVTPDRATKSAKVFVSYEFYNGSGTWRGSQNLIVTLLGSNKRPLGQLTIPLDRGKCVYGAAESRSYTGVVQNLAERIQSIDAMVTRVSGVQTRC
jgi:hypothetical protein